MIIAQRDAAGDYVVRHNLPIDKLADIIMRNVRVYSEEVARVFKKHGSRCVFCNSIFAPPEPSALKDKTGEPLYKVHVCNTCTELMHIFSPYLQRMIERERAEHAQKASNSAKRLLHEMNDYEENDDEDDEHERR